MTPKMQGIKRKCCWPGAVRTLVDYLLTWMFGGHMKEAAKLPSSVLLGSGVGSELLEFHQGCSD